MADRFIQPMNAIDELAASVQPSVPFAVRAGPESIQSYTLKDTSLSTATNPSAKLSFSRNFQTHLLLKPVMYLKHTLGCSFLSEYTSNGLWGFSQGNNFTPRGPLPLQVSMASSTQLSINSEPLSFENKDLANALSRCIDRDELRMIADYCPVEHRRFLSYILEDPAFQGAESSYGEHRGNNRFNVIKTVAPSVAGATTQGDACKVTLSYSVVEPLFHPYCNLTSLSENQIPFVQCQNVSLNISLDGQGCPFYFDSNLMAAVTGGNVTNFVSNSELIIVGSTAPEGYPVPKRSVKPFYLPSSISSTVPEKAPGGSGTAQSATMNMTTIPEYLLIYFKKNSSNTPASEENSLVITNVSLQYDNMSSLLADMSAEELYEVSRKNGMNTDWNQFSGEAQVLQKSYVSTYTANPAIAVTTVEQYALNKHSTYGSYVLVAMSDFNMKLGQVAGVSAAKDLSVKVSFKNQSTEDASNFSLMVAAIHPALFVTEGGSSKKVERLLSSAEAGSKMLIEGQPTTEISPDFRIGGGFLSGLKKFAKKAMPILRPVLKAASKAASREVSSLGPGGMALGAALDQLGSGTIIAGGMARDERFY